MVWIHCQVDGNPERHIDTRASAQIQLNVPRGVYCRWPQNCKVLGWWTDHKYPSFSLSFWSNGIFLTLDYKLGVFPSWISFTALNLMTCYSSETFIPIIQSFAINFPKSNTVVPLPSPVQMSKRLSTCKIWRYILPYNNQLVWKNCLSVCIVKWTRPNTRVLWFRF